jgi:AcrR family transcriptional regulator
MTGKPKRIRRTREASKQAILEAAEKRLAAEGPDGVKVQLVAADLGMTDAALHYHFGNREALMVALLSFAGRRLVADVRRAIAGWEAASFDMRALARLLHKSYAEKGVARLALWLALSGWKSRGSGMLNELVGEVHRLRAARARADGRRAPPIAGTRHALALLNAACLMQPLIGEAMLRAVDAPADAAGERRYLDAVAAIVQAHLENS